MQAVRTGLRLGIGDDAALLAPRRGFDVVLSSDFFIEGAHFIVGVHPPESVGYKSLIRAVSDLSAMGAEPGYFLLNLALPSEKTGAWLDGFVRGLGSAAHEASILLIGGDLAKSAKVSIAITVIGYVKAGQATLRSGARPGDLIYVSGRLGAARLGLEIIRKRRRDVAGARRLLAPHLYPPLRIELGAWIASAGIASAMMDISDGLSIDLARMCEASGVGAAIEAERIPRAAISSAWMKRLRLPPSAPLEFALHGGDDYELLMTIPPHRAHKLRRVPGGIPLTCIGEITRERRIILVDDAGRTKPLQPKGWDHFSRHA
ncbi:MAG: thiamine-phosphate kinase [Candidatus Acidiferrales bacterium]